MMHVVFRGKLFTFASVSLFSRRLSRFNQKVEQHPSGWRVLLFWNYACIYSVFSVKTIIFKNSLFCGCKITWKKWNHKEIAKYFESEKIYRDLVGAFRTASVEEIAEMTDLTVDEVISAWLYNCLLAFYDKWFLLHSLLFILHSLLFILHFLLFILHSLHLGVCYLTPSCIGLYTLIYGKSHRD